MKNFGVILLLFVFHSSAKAEKGVVVNILPDKLILSADCEVQANLQRLQSQPENFSVLYICKNSDNGRYFLDFRLNNIDLVANFKRRSTDVVVNKSKFKSYIFYELMAKGSNGKQSKFVSYCTKELCLDLVGEYEKSIKASITSQLQK